MIPNFFKRASRSAWLKLISKMQVGPTRYGLGPLTTKGVVMLRLFAVLLALAPGVALSCGSYQTCNDIFILKFDATPLYRAEGDPVKVSLHSFEFANWLSSVSSMTFTPVVLGSVVQRTLPGTTVQTSNSGPFVYGTFPYYWLVQNTEWDSTLAWDGLDVNGQEVADAALLTVNVYAGAATVSRSVALLVTSGKNLGKPACPLGNPCNPATGNKYQEEVDFSGGALTPGFTRHYNHMAATDVGLGVGWTSNYHARLRPDGGKLTVVRADGRRERLTQSGAAWIPDADSRLKVVSSVSGFTLTLDSGTVETYSTLGKLLSITDRAGFTQSLTYSDGSAGPNGGYVVDALGNPTATLLPAGLLIRVTDASLRSLNFSYNAESRLALMTDPAGGKFIYAYVGNNLVSVTYPDTHTRTYVYNEAAFTSNTDLPHALTGILDENNIRFATWNYSTQGKVLSSEHAGGAEKVTFNYTFDASTNNGNGTTIATDALGTARTYQFQTILGDIKNTSISQPCVSCGGTSTATTGYDSNGNVASRSDFNNNVTTYIFDLARNLEISRTEASGKPEARTITTTWHSVFRLPAEITEAVGKPEQRITTFTYDPASGNPLSKTITSNAGSYSRTWSSTYTTAADGTLPNLLKSVNGPRLDVADITTYGYYPNGDLKTITNALAQVTTITAYDPNGRPQSLTDANGLITDLTYYPRGWLKTRSVGSAASGYLTTTYDYDFVGQIKKATLPDGSFLAYDYDGAHRLTRIGDTLGNKIEYTLDNMGNRIAENSFDPQGALAKTHAREFDALSRLLKDIGGSNPLIQFSTFGYDANGNLTSATDALARTTTQSYDELDRLTKVTDPFNGTTAPTLYAYNAQDQLSQVTDPKGLNTSYTYNGLGEMLTQTSPDTGITSFTYDTAGNLKTKTDARNVTATYSYDALNRVGAIAYPAVGSDPAETVTYSYDVCANGKGRLCTLTDKSGTTSYTYDLFGRITAKSQTIGAVTQTIGYAYNSVGQLASVTTPAGKSVTYAYQNNQPVAMAVNGTIVLDQAVYKPFGPISGWRWGNSTTSQPNFHVRAYDKDYRASSVTSDRVGAGSLTRNYTWSDVSTISAITDPASAANSFTYGYDTLDRLSNAVAAGASPATFGYSYDGDGNRLTQTTAAGTTIYAYPATNNRLASLSGATVKTYQYDAVGNLTNDGLNTWSYGGNNRPTQVSNATATTQFFINALGQRVKKSGAGTDKHFVYDEAGRLWGEYDNSGNLIAETIWFNDLPVAVLK